MPKVQFSAMIRKEDKGWTLTTNRANRKRKGEAKAGSFGLSTLTEVTAYVEGEFKKHQQAEANFA